MRQPEDIAACHGGAAVITGATRAGISLEPATAYEAVTRQMVVDLSDELREIKARLNGLLFMVAGSVLLEIITRVMG